MTSAYSFLNGVIAGAGAVLAIMSVAFLQSVAPLEGVMGFTTTEIRVAIFLGGIVCAAAVAYEFYRKKETKEQDNQLERKDLGIEKEKIAQTTETEEIQETMQREDKGVSKDE